jgi:hypothetical protein
MASDSDSDCEIVHKTCEYDWDDYKGENNDDLWKDHESEGEDDITVLPGDPVTFSDEEDYYTENADPDSPNLLQEATPEASPAPSPPPPEEAAALVCEQCFSEYPLEEANDHNLCAPCRTQHFLYN